MTVSAERSDEEKMADLARLWEKLSSFCTQAPFAELVAQMWALPPDLQHEFAELTILDPPFLRDRGISVPDGVIVQRSWFEDQRPTVFCVCAKLPSDFEWDKITVTFDASSGKLPQPRWRRENLDAAGGVLRS